MWCNLEYPVIFSNFHLNLFLDSINPVYTTKPTGDKLIRLVAIVFICLVIYQFFGNLDFIQSIFSGRLSIRNVLSLLPFMMLSGGVISFLLRKKIGWILLCLYCSNTFPYYLMTFYASLAKRYLEIEHFSLRQLPSPGSVLFVLLFYAGSLYTICREKVRIFYRINRDVMWMVVTIGVMIGVVLMFGLRKM